jgi:benzoyl-CoA reductase/2-hydroxyglutaryl-CoA dehydratase subunit BcrC/BadD/HgdB
MENTNTNNKKKWYEVLEDRFNSLMIKFDMPEDIGHEIYSFVLETAREQYKSGNRSGISWLKKQQAIEMAKAYNGAAA